MTRGTINAILTKVEFFNAFCNKFDVFCKIGLPLMNLSLLTKYADFVLMDDVKTIKSFVVVSSADCRQPELNLCFFDNLCQC